MGEPIDGMGELVRSLLPHFTLAGSHSLEHSADYVQGVRI